MLYLLNDKPILKVLDTLPHAATTEVIYIGPPCVWLQIWSDGKGIGSWHIGIEGSSRATDFLFGDICIRRNQEGIWLPLMIPDLYTNGDSLGMVSRLYLLEQLPPYIRFKLSLADKPSSISLALALPQPSFRPSDDLSF